MGHILSGVDGEIQRLTEALFEQQQPNGSWHFCFENGVVIDAYMIILLRTLNSSDEALIRQLHDRILAEQQPDGCWKLFQDETAGNLSTSVEAYYALLYSGCSKTGDEHIQRAKQYIQSRGGFGKVTSIFTKTILTITGQRRWPASISSIPLEAMLLPNSLPVNLYEFSGYSRVHLVPMLILADRQFSVQTKYTPDLTDLNKSDEAHPDGDERLERGFQDMLSSLQDGLKWLIGAPHSLHEAATSKAEQFMLDRIESDGTLYSYASSTILMIFALLALGYDKQDPVIRHAVQGITQMRYNFDGKTTIQNSPSTIWDTALLAYSLQESGVSHNHPVILKSAAYLLSNQQYKKADWSLHNPHTTPGGWGFSETNTINPDVDDSTAVLRAIKGLSAVDPTYRESWNRGLNWVLSMQNDDGGWPAFEKNTNNHMLTWLAIDGAKSAAIDPSEADLTGRTLEYLGHFASLGTRHKWIERGVAWLINNQEKNGSWYGRWGVCYIYGTWAALTGLRACGIPANHKTVQQGTEWLLSIQNSDGGWGESCKSDRLLRYVPLGASTPSQTAWALDALIAVHEQPTSAIDQGIRRLISSLHEENWTTSYPTGAGLPGNYYSHYHSYRYIWPLLALSHYWQKYGTLV